MAWNRFWKWLLYSLLVALGSLIAAIAVLDPYGNLPFRPLVKPWPISTNQRYSYPAIARNPAFDSALLGTSTSHILKPRVLDKALGTRIANLSMSSARAYEQARIYEVFLQQHRQPKVLLIGLDIVWCEKGEKLDRTTFRPFPEWMYDDNPWNDFLHFIEFRTLKTLFRKTRFLLGIRGPRFGEDGYYNFLPPKEEYDLTKARQNLYKGRNPARPKSSHSTEIRAIDTSDWKFPSHKLLVDLLGSTPAETRKVLVFVPYHHFHQPAPASREHALWSTCKRRIRDIAGNFANSVLLDFMIPSPLTTRDENYWDSLHYTHEVADRLAELIGRGARGEPAPDREYRILHPDRPQ